MEMVECFNKSNESTQKTIPRNQMKNHSCYFRVVHLWLEKDGHFLVQKRAKKSDDIPFMWAFTTGLVDPYEDPILAIIREAKEELNLSLDQRDLSLIKIVPTHQHPYKTFTYVFYHKLKEPTLFTLNEEVQATDFWSVKSINTAINNGSFWNYPKLLNDLDYLKELYEKRL